MIKRNAPSKNGKLKASFVLPLSETPEPVSVLGDFNSWDPLAHPLKKRANGTRSATVELEPSARYAFKYLSGSGTWFNDPEADAHDVNEYGETNSVLTT
ncbi:MAG: isoamylase early set domain-containing protein [Actinobacteria bacterium]|nr:isoamylase early set domain-containing protein [Actinomycetota bacterium]